MAMTGLLIFLAISAVTAVVANLLTRRSVVATAVAAPLASALFFLVLLAVEKPGPLDALVPCFATVYALPVAILVALASPSTGNAPAPCRAIAGHAAIT